MLFRVLNAVCYTLLLCNYVRAQSTTFHHLTPFDGLAQNTVCQIAQDTSGFLWFATPNGLSRYDSREVKNYRHRADQAGSLSSNNVRSVFCDSHGSIWVGTQTGLNLYDPLSDSFTHFANDAGDTSSLSSNSVRSFAEDIHGQLWIGTANGINRLVRLNGGGFQFRRFLTTAQKEGPDAKGADGTVVYDLHRDHTGILWAATSNGLAKIQDNGKRIRVIRDGFGDMRIRAVGSDNSGKLWVGTVKGMLTRFNPVDGSMQTWESAPGMPSEKFDTILRIFRDSNGQMWIGTLSGLFRIDPKQQVSAVFRHDDLQPGSVSDNSIYWIFEDRQKILWFGAYYGGANFIYPQSHPFRALWQTGKKMVNAVVEDVGGNLWLSLYRDKVQRIAPNGVVTHTIALDKNNAEECRVLHLDKKGNLWLGNNYNNVVRYDPVTRTSTSFQVKFPVEDSQEPHQHHITALLEDHSGRFWVATSRDGLHLLDPATGHIARFAPAGHAARLGHVSCLYEDDEGNVWIGVRNGAFILRPGEKVPVWVPATGIDAMATSEGTPSAIWNDHKGRVWLGTRYRGLQRYDPVRNILVPQALPYGLSEAYIGNLFGDRQGYLWMSLDNGLVRFHPDNQTIQMYTVADGLPGNEIVAGAWCTRATGEIVFGFSGGAFRFDPRQIVMNNVRPNVVFTALKIFNQTVAVNDKHKVLESDINRVGEIRLNHQQNIFTIDFSVLNFHQPEKNLYAYKLEGFEDKWNYVRNPSATYTSLPPGRYVFCARGANNDGVWCASPRRLVIVIQEPWWESWPAYLAYAVFLAIVGFLFIRFFWLRGMLRKENELYQSKLDFFTNISHEIRTHLTLIGIPVRKLLDSPNTDAESLKLLRTTNRNTEQLMALVEELLDFRKFERRKVSLHVQHGELVAFVQNCVAAFEHISEAKQVQTTFATSDRKVWIWYDPGQLQKVIYNLLQNAYKFAPAAGTVQVVVADGDSDAVITISDDGQGIAQEHLDKLFTNFFQVYEHEAVNTGYGIGLAIAKNIIDLHGGVLTVKSSQAGPERGSAFSIRLFKGITHFDDKVTLFDDMDHMAETTELINPAGKSAYDSRPSGLSEKHSVLLVEDNDELRGFCREALKAHFNVYEAADGEDGWHKVLEHIPDIVISDVMMPGTDGIKLCARIKSDLRSSHIPVIFLTAKSTLNQQMEGFLAGADDYIAKPFHVEILELKIRNILATRQAIHQTYTRRLLSGGQYPQDDNNSQFLSMITHTIQQQMGNPGFTTQQLASHIGMSKSVLYKKVKVLTGLTVNEFVKLIRMKEASELLKQSGATVGEVAQMVGFEDAKYFSREFKRQFGVLPKEWSISSLNVDLAIGIAGPNAENSSIHGLPG